MAYIDKYGVEYSDDKTVLVCCPCTFEGRRYEGEFVIPQGVKTIAKQAFLFGGKNITSIVFPESLIEIEEEAFKGCENLRELVFPINLKHIGNEAFYGCSRIETITFPNNLESIGEQAFEGCGIGRSWLSEVHIPTSIKQIGKEAFAHSGIASLSLPEDSKLEIIENGVFRGSSIRTIALPPAIREIKQEAFKCCKDLKTIIIQNDNILLGNSTFDGCKNLSKIIVPKGRKKWIIMHNSHLHNCYPVIEVRKSIEEIIEESDR